MAAGANVVEILVTATDSTAAGMASAKASAEGAAEGMDTLAAAQDKVTEAEIKLTDALTAQTDAQLRLEELQQSGTASADEIAAAQDKVTQATIASADAQLRLGAADAQVAASVEGRLRGCGRGAGREARKSPPLRRTRGRLGFSHFQGIATRARAGVAIVGVDHGSEVPVSDGAAGHAGGGAAAGAGGPGPGCCSWPARWGSPRIRWQSRCITSSRTWRRWGITAARCWTLVKVAAEGAKVGGAEPGGRDERADRRRGVRDPRREELLARRWAC